jgi:hypothetical protein
MTVTETLTPHLGSQDALGHLSSEGRSILFTEARTANSFAPIPVTDQDLAGIWDLAKWGPSAANTQPLRVLYVRTPEGKARLLPHISEGNRDKTASAPAVAVLARDTRFHEHIPTVLPFRPEMREVFEENEEMRHGIGTFSAALQAGYFISRSTRGPGAPRSSAESWSSIGGASTRQRAATRRTRRDLWLAAVFLWMTPGRPPCRSASRPGAAARRCPRHRSRPPDGVLGAGAQLGAHRLVAQPALLVLAVPLDLALDVGHVSILSAFEMVYGGRRWARRASSPVRGQL